MDAGPLGPYEWVKYAFSMYLRIWDDEHVFINFMSRLYVPFPVCIQFQTVTVKFFCQLKNSIHYLLRG